LKGGDAGEPTANWKDDAMSPSNVYEVLQLLKTYHQQRRDTYRQLADSGSEERACLLLRHLVVLEENALEIIGAEIARLQPDHAAHLMPGPTLTIAPAHAMDCRCDSQPTFEEALGCALSSDAALDELIDRISGSSRAPSVQDLAARLRDLERTKDREIAKFTRED
jgi:hypothetical protein